MNKEINSIINNIFFSSKNEKIIQESLQKKSNNNKIKGIYIF